MSTVAAPAPTRADAVHAHDRRLDILAIALPAVLALALCLFELDSRSLWLDEAATASIASQHGSALAAAVARDGGNMLGYYGLLHVLIGMFGNGVIVLRLPSAIGAGTTVALTGVIGLRLWDRGTALISGVIAAVSLTLVYWGQDARSYSLMVALIAASFLALVEVVGSERPRWGAWTAYVVLTVAAIYAALAAALVVPAQLLALVWRRARWRLVVGGAAVAGACCIPLAVLAAERGSSQLFWVPSPSLRTAKQVLQALTSSGLQPGYYTSSGDALLILTVVVVLGALWRCAWILAARGARGDALGPGLVGAWLLVPMVAALLVSVTGHSIFQARYVLVSLPAVALLLAWALRTRWLPRAAAAVLLAALIALRALALAPSYGASSEEWRAATSYVVAHARAGDCTAFYPLDARMPFEYYAGAGRHPPPSVLPMLPWGEVRSFVEQYRGLAAGRVSALPATCSRVWLVWSHEGKLGGPAIAGANFRRLAGLRAALATRYRTRATRRFGHASPISIELFAGASRAPTAGA